MDCVKTSVPCLFGAIVNYVSFVADEGGEGTRFA